MKTVTIRELHARTGELVRQSKRYGQILVTDNGRAVARIVPEADSDDAPYFARREPSAAFLRLDRSGKTAGGANATQSISEDRDDRV